MRARLYRLLPLAFSLALAVLVALDVALLLGVRP